MNANTATAGVSVAALSVSSASGQLVAPLSFTVAPGETLALIGESGSGKTMTARALTGLLPKGVRASGKAEIAGHSINLTSPGEDASWHSVRGRLAVLLLQDPFTSLSPVLRCGKQLALTIRAREKSRGNTISKKALAAEVTQRLAEVQLPERVAKQYPTELSGGMRQRVAIACALAADPQLLIADEPTTALDASNQGEVLDLLRELQRKHNTSIILISHDLGVIRGRADSVIVLRNGEAVESGRTAAVLGSPQHEYTRNLIAANPSLAEATERNTTATGTELFSGNNISKSFGDFQALQDVSLTVGEGEIVALVGESGSGKSTLARIIAGLSTPDAGTMRLQGKELAAGRKGRTPGQVQVVFQDPYSTLNPSFTVAQTLEEARQAGGANPPTAQQLLELVELDPALASRRPSQLSGGQRQRVAIARALAVSPALLLCDECVSALDVSVQAQVLQLLSTLRAELGLGMLFITHDLGVVARIADRVLVLKQGEIVEQGPVSQVLGSPQHEYTKSLVAAAERENS